MLSTSFLDCMQFNKSLRLLEGVLRVWKSRQKSSPLMCWKAHRARSLNAGGIQVLQEARRSKCLSFDVSVNSYSHSHLYTACFVRDVRWLERQRWKGTASFVNRPFLPLRARQLFMILAASKQMVCMREKMQSLNYISLNDETRTSFIDEATPALSRWYAGCWGSWEKATASPLSYKKEFLSVKGMISL